ncbi:MAG: hypothetical protein WDN01_14520 [Rhizomicrobium sp.]
MINKTGWTVWSMSRLEAGVSQRHKVQPLRGNQEHHDRGEKSCVKP